MKDRQTSGNNVAKQHLFAGEFQQAHAAAQRQIRQDNQDLEAVLVLAAIAIEHGNGPGGAKLCQMVRDAGDDSCWLAVLEARVALMQQDQERARERALYASKRRTDDIHIANQLGVVLSRTGYHAEAVAPFQQAVEGKPGDADYRYNLAIALQFAGDLRQAEEHLGILVCDHPAHAKGWLAMVQLVDEPQPEWTSKLEKQFEAARDVDDLLTFGHALARLAELRGNWNEALVWLDRAKERKALDVKHDRAATEALYGAAIACADNADIQPAPSGDTRPIFVLGMPRSGTTLVERILSSHPQVVSLGELSDFAIIAKRVLQTPGPLVLEPGLLRAAAERTDITEIGHRYLQRTAPLAGDATHFIDKMPFNAFFVPAILQALPGARVICLRRSPFDVLFANYRQLFATGFSYYSYAYDFGDAAHFVAHFEKLAEIYETTMPADRYLPVRYEDVIDDQRGQTERLLSFCGLEWDDACMRFHENAQPVATASSVQVRSPIYASSKGKWRRYSEGSQRAISELARYGIEPDVEI